MRSIIDFLKHWDLLGFVIAAIISLIVGLIFNGLKNLVSMKRKLYNISRQTINRTIYDNRIDGDFSIKVSYKGEFYEDSLTLLRIRLLNDGQNDINYIRQCAKPILIIIDGSSDIVDVLVEPSNGDMEAIVSRNGDNKYDLSWSLLKKDEYIDLVIIAKGKVFSSDQVKIIVRAEGLDKIKSPEYRVWPQLWPMLSANIVVAIASWFIFPARITYIPYIPENVFWTGLAVLMIPLYVIMVLARRIKWEKE